MNANETKRIVLKKDWDIPPRFSLDSKKFEGHFAGRKRELDLLVNEILHKTSGSILVSGHRGVGKTSLVYKALVEVLKRKKDIIIVLMNAAQLEAELKDKSENISINPREIIENLIRRLYTATRDNKELDDNIRKDIENLYKKAVAKEFKLTELFTGKVQEMKQMEEEKTREILINENILHIVIFIICWAIGVFFIVFNLTPFEWLNKLIGLSLTFPVPYVLNLIYRKREIKKSLKEISTQAKKLYELDNKISNLEFDLEEIHKKISESGKRLVYVIDELDKLEIEQVKESLKYFKHLFTLSDALFIFIGGEEIYNIGLNRQENTVIYREKEYTYFTSRYFLTRPLYPDLSDFLDEIVERKEGLTDEEYEIFKRVLCFEAKNDFFDLKKCIRDKIAYYTEEGNPVIDTSNITNDDDYDKKFKLHKVITVLFEDKYMSLEISKWKENEELLRTIFKYAEDIYNLFPGAQVSDPDGEEVKYELIRDFNNLLYRYGAFSVQQGNPKNIRGIEVQIRTYNYLGRIPNNPPDSLEELTEYERRFVEGFENWVGYLLALYNVFNEVKGGNKITNEEFLENPNFIFNALSSWGYNYNILSVFSNYIVIYNNLTRRKPPYPYRREEVEKFNTEIQNYLNQLKNNYLPNSIIPKQIRQLYSNLNLSVQNLQQNPQLFSGSANQIRINLQSFNPIVLFSQNLDRQILFIYNHLDEIKQIEKVLKDNKGTHRIVMITPTEVDEKIEGLHVVRVDNPQKFQEDLIRLYQELKEFLIDFLSELLSEFFK